MQRIKKDHQYKTLRRIHRAIGGKCYLCDCELHEDDMTKDHVFPKSHGYSITRNMMPAHKNCNIAKGDSIPTLQEIEYVSEVYESLFMTFSPFTEFERTAFTKPIQFFVKRLTA
jgi:5-methylcytosine-specific restriction endonuclease McrA